MTNETKFFLGVIGVTLVILVGALMVFSKPAKEISVKTLVPDENVLGTGSATPKVTLVEFSDFECPACGSAHPVVKNAVSKYKDELRFIYRHFPLAQHPYAQKAAEVSEAAASQGKFWEMHDLLFDNQKNLSDETFTKLATQLGLNMEQFNKDLAEGRFTGEVAKDLSDGKALGVNATPTFFLNGKKLNLFSFADLETEIEKALKN